MFTVNWRQQNGSVCERPSIISSLKAAYISIAVWIIGTVLLEFNLLFTYVVLVLLCLRQ